VFLGTTSGGLWQYDPRQRVKRFIAGPASGAERDHAQVQAFLGEVWVMGGRFPETSTVAIYDPVTEQWRDGPRLANFRAGIAATVVGNQLVVGGGELIAADRLVPTVEAYAAGTESWRIVTNLPIAVHGNAAATLGNRAYFISGGTVPSSGCCATGRLFSLEQTAP
jgi:hypothetical protein